MLLVIVRFHYALQKYWFRTDLEINFNQMDLCHRQHVDKQQSSSPLRVKGFAHTHRSGLHGSSVSTH